MNSSERRVLINTCYGHFLCHVNMLVFPAVVLPLVGRLGISLSEAIQISFWMYMLLGLMALPWGAAADRWGADPLMRIFYLGAGFSGLAAALVIDLPSSLALALAGLGLFSGIYHPAGMGLISKNIRQVGFALGVNGMFGNLGMAVAPLLAGLMTWIWGPRAVFILVGILNFGGLALTGRTEGESPAESGTLAEGNNINWLLPFTILMVAAILGGVVYRGATVITPIYFELKLKILYRALTGLFGSNISPNLVATSITSLIFIVGMLGQYSGGKMADRFDPRMGYLLFSTVMVPAAFLIAWLPELPLVAMVFVYFFFLLGMQPVENTLVARMIPQRYHHTAFGLRFILTFGVGALAVKMIGFIENNYGLEPVFIALGGFGIALVIAVLVLIGVTRPHKAVRRA